MINIKSKETTHNFLHERGLLILGNDLEKIMQILSRDTRNLICEEDIKKVRKNYDVLYRKRMEYIQHANDPDKKENNAFIELYQFDKNYGMKVRGIKFIPRMFTQHFYSPNEGSNYISFRNKLVRYLCSVKSEKIKQVGYWLKKQGLTFNAQELFLRHAKKAIEIFEHNNSIIDDSIIIELSKATHYLEDMCETHHVTNKIGIGKLSFLLRIPVIKDIPRKKISNHSEFEEYAFINKEKYKLTSVEEFSNIQSLRFEEKEFWSKFNYYTEFLDYSYMQNTKGIKCFIQICRWYSVYSSCFASGECSFYDQPSDIKYNDKVLWALSDNNNDWNKNIEQTLKLAQVNVAVFYLAFYYIYQHLIYLISLCSKQKNNFPLSI